jgi:hypothetical protein
VKIIVDQVPNSAIKNLRLTCRSYSETAALRLDRVFISANTRNVEVFTAIANHDVFRAQITEIIWDDALLYVRPKLRDKVEAYYGSDDDYEDYGNEDGDECDEDGIDWRGDVPGWFRKACRENIFSVGSEAIQTTCSIQGARYIAYFPQNSEETDNIHSLKPYIVSVG